jgi:hypothetical protein
MFAGQIGAKLRRAALSIRMQELRVQKMSALAAAM